MNPLDRFEFSQSSLQDYTDCRRRFQLRYIEHVRWPAVQAEPARENEQHIQRGERFHRLVQQYLIGVPQERLARFAEADPDENLQNWWQNFINTIPQTLQGQRYVEAGLEVPLDGSRIVVRYDLVLIRPDEKIIIYDWKTNLRRPKREVLLARLQTRVYPYVLVKAGAALNNGKPVSPEQVEMIYWFAEPGQSPEHLVYSAAQFQRDEQDLRALIAEIRSLKPEAFALTANESNCRFCVYRSLCNRGTEAADLINDETYESSDASDLDFDLEQIGEISF